ncbi:uncharacterized protein LOC116201197 [Punica granatum]|uniref:Uncharacterized protein LOC116201197 n=1 Tax=Punica granatum TaxID=22663 RepID=A0A218VZ16_PUNGR|nr:uncharacterized protein LOC116201197 [Punica granatum]OWM65656.1 hypothetical protein CDL15_Pgr017153 [Punica granatum]
MEPTDHQVPSIDELHKRISAIEQKTPRKRHLGALISVSEEELKIRDELEEDVERNLEEEIKDQIYHLSLRLSRLYQHRKEIINARGGHDLHPERSFCEVNISIKMEGGMKIQIKETKKPESQDIRARPHHRVAAPVSAASRSVASTSGKSFNWVRTLRSS